MNTEAADAIRMYALTSPLSTLTESDVVVREEWQGSDNLLWRLGVAPAPGSAAALAPDSAPAPDVVIKMYMDAGWVRGRREYEAQQIFAPRGLAPQPLWFDRDAELLPRQVVGYRYVEGAPPDMANGDIRQAVAVAIAQVHGSDAAAMARFSPNPMNFDTFWTLLQENIATVHTEVEKNTALADALDTLLGAARAVAASAAPLWANMAPAPIHGEFGPDNILIGPAGVTFVDWELSGLGDPALEIARFVQGHLADNGVRDGWLATYLQENSAPNMAERIAIYRRLLPIEWLCILLGGLEDAVATFGAAIHDDMVNLIAAVFAGAASAMEIAQTPSRAAIEQLLQSLALGERS